MHQKKSELQIGRESRGVSSDFNPLHHHIYPLHHHHHHHRQQWPSHLHHPHLFFHQNQIQNPTMQTHHTNPNPNPNETTPLIHKRPIMATVPSSISRSPTLTAFHSTLPPSSSSSSTLLRRILRRIATKPKTHLHLHLRLLLPPSLIIAIPCFWWYLKTSPSDRSLLGLWFDFFSALTFAAALLVSLKLALPFAPSLRLLRCSLARSFASISVSPSIRLRSSPPPVLWSIGSKPKSENRVRNPDSGEGVLVYSNGDVYEGEFHQGKCSGSGVYYYYMSGRYEGEWVDEKYDGYGVETWARGSRYRGQYRQGLRHGFGVYRFYTGDVYAGEWSNGQSHGCGVHTCEDGSRYVGEFKWGVKHGLGHYHFRNGDTYAGEYFADKMHGFGVYRFANGHRYEGAWHEGKKQGLGMYTFRNGETQSGHWQNGILETPSTQNNLPGSPVAVNHSKVLNAVQEARRASEKAFDVARVDDRVNKAVAAANRAANAARVAAVKAVQKKMHNNNDDIPIPIV